MIEKKVIENEKIVAQRLDSLIAMGVSIEKPVRSIWYKIHQPTCISRKKIPLFLRARVSEFKTQIVENITDTFAVRIGLVTRLFIESDSVFQDAVPDLPPYQKKKHIQDTLKAYALLTAQFDVISDSLNAYLEKKPVSWNQYSATISEVHISGEKNRIKLTAKLKGDINGDLVLLGVPSIDNTQNTVFFTDYSFSLDTKNDILNIGLNSLKEGVVALLEEYLVLDVDSWMREIPEAIERGVEKGKAGDVVAVDMQTLDVDVLSISIEKKQIILIASGRGKGVLTLEKIVQ
jgi:hypothetical protein